MNVELLRGLYRLDERSPSGVVFNGDRKRGTAKDGAAALTTLKANGSGIRYYCGVYTDCSGTTKRMVALLAHRVVFALAHGYWPETVDHKDGDPLNNRVDNLREATRQEQAMNRTVSTRSGTGVKGVYKLPSGRFQSSICLLGKRKNLGVWDTIEEARAVYLQHSTELHGEFSIGNRDV